MPDQEKGHICPMCEREILYGHPVVCRWCKLVACQACIDDHECVTEPETGSTF